MVECKYSEKLKNFDSFDQRIKPTYKGPWIRSLVGYEFSSEWSEFDGSC